MPLLVLFLGLVVPNGRLHPTALWRRLARLVGPATGRGGHSTGCDGRSGDRIERKGLKQTVL